MTINFCFMLKTYDADYPYVCRLVKTYMEYNKEHIKLFIVVPNGDYHIFEVFANEDIQIIGEENVCADIFLESQHGLKAGYLNQEIFKLAFWELGVCSNYCCLDSECYFIRDFFVKDFMHDSQTPYSVLIEDKDLKVEPQYYKFYWKTRESFIEIIKEQIDFKEDKTLTCHGFQNISCTVMKNFYTDFMMEKAYSYKDIINLAPYEFSWYNLWLQKSKIIPIYISEPIFKTYHMKSQHIKDYFAGITEKDLARSYIGIVINGNFADGERLIGYKDVKLYHGYNDEERLTVQGIKMLCQLLFSQVKLWCRCVWKMLLIRIK